MNYTLAEVQEIQSHDTVYLVANGNQFYIEYLSQGKQTVRKHFGEINEASEIFAKFAKAFSMGLYSYSDRKSWLE